MVPRALAVASELALEGISVEVVDPRTVRPLDMETIAASVRKTGRVLIVHEANTIGGIGGEIGASLADIAFDALEAPIKRLGALEVPIPMSPAMERMVVPTEASIREAVAGLLAGAPEC